MPVNKSASVQIDAILKNKKILFAMDGVEDEKSGYQFSLYGALKTLFGNVILFNPRKYVVNVGHEQTTAHLLKVIQTESPDFFLFFPARNSTGVLTLEIIRKINQESLKTKTIAFLGDDDRDFECFSRYLILFVDYALVAQHNYMSVYEKEGFGSKVFPINVADSDLFKPCKTEKKYDLVFIGTPSYNRIEWMRYLIRNGINLRIYGYNWSDYPEFRDFYFGVVSNDELVRIINQSKINLSFSQNEVGKLHYKGRVFEVAECKAFQLVEYFDGYLNFFKDNYEIVMFKDGGDLLEKIEYYLKNEVEREKIAERAYRKIIKTYELKIELRNFFRKVIDENCSYRIMHVVRKKVVSINKELLSRSVSEITEKIINSYYVSFFDARDEIFEFKNNIQTHSLIQTGKDISCCGYYISSKSLGDYLFFRGNLLVSEDEFNQALDLTQIMVSKDYFLKNLEAFREFYSGNKVNIVKKSNTTFIDIPLYRTESLRKTADYKVIESVFKGGCLFLMTLQPLINNKKILFDTYLYKLLVVSLLNGNTFVLKHLFVSLFNRRYWNRLLGNKKNFIEL